MIGLHTFAKRVPWRQPKMVFVDSMSDLFHELVSDDFMDQVFATMSLARRQQERGRPHEPDVRKRLAGLSVLRP